MFIIHVALFITIVLVKVLAVPPAICREEFRWDDCGLPPKPVMYYFKKGSRCEVGLWKGCLPNPNMFVDEYQCINTCIFQEHPVERIEAETEDYNEASSDEEKNTTEHNGTEGVETTEGKNDTKTDENETTPGGNTTAEGIPSESDKPTEEIPSGSDKPTDEVASASDKPTEDGTPSASDQPTEDGTPSASDQPAGTDEGTDAVTDAGTEAGNDDPPA